MENDSQIILKYPPYLFHWSAQLHTLRQASLVHSDTATIWAVNGKGADQTVHMEADLCIFYWHRFSNTCIVCGCMEWMIT